MNSTAPYVRKSMWIHPTLDRAISIREAARLQTFPDSFVFCGSKDKQYQQVGNAVPPIMAKAIAKQLASTLGKKLRGRTRKWLIITQKKFAAKICHIFEARIQSQKRLLGSICFLKAFDTEKMFEHCRDALILFCLNIIP